MHIYIYGLYIFIPFNDFAFRLLIIRASLDNNYHMQVRNNLDDLRRRLGRPEASSTPLSSTKMPIKIDDDEPVASSGSMSSKTSKASKVGMSRRNKDVD